MQTARLTQQHYGFFRQSTVSRKETGADKAEANRSRPSVLPAERVVEGELLRNRNARAGDSLDQILQRGRFATGATNSTDTTLSTPAAQRAISAYLDNSASPHAGNGGAQPRSIDYYA
jgi:hypothetical protein